MVYEKREVSWKELLEKMKVANDVVYTGEVFIIECNNGSIFVYSLLPGTITLGGEEK